MISEITHVVRHQLLHGALGWACAREDEPRPLAIGAYRFVELNPAPYPLLRGSVTELLRNTPAVRYLLVCGTTETAMLRWTTYGGGFPPAGGLCFEGVRLLRVDEFQVPNGHVVACELIAQQTLEELRGTARPGRYLNLTNPYG